MRALVPPEAAVSFEGVPVEFLGGVLDGDGREKEKLGPGGGVDAAAGFDGSGDLEVECSLESVSRHGDLMLPSLYGGKDGGYCILREEPTLVSFNSLAL